MTDPTQTAASWRSLVVDTARDHAAALWLVAFIVMAHFAAVTTAALLHTNGLPIEVLAAAEARTGESLAAQMYTPGAIVSLAVQVAGALAALHGWVTNR